MPVRRFHARLLVLVALLALGGQAAVVFESAWHTHDHGTQDGHQDGCTICAAVSQTGTPVPELPTVDRPAPVDIIRIAGQARPAHLFAAPAIAPRGPPAQAV